MPVVFVQQSYGTCPTHKKLKAKMLWLRQRRGQANSSPNPPPKTFLEGPPQSMATASITHWTHCFLPALTTGHSDWSALMNKISPNDLSPTAPPLQ